MMTKPETDMIDTILAQAGAQDPAVSDELMARVMADAAQMRPLPAPRRRSIWAQFLDLIGGWPSVGGLAMAGVAGIWVGVAPPPAVSTWTAELIGTPVTIDLFGDGIDYFTEGLADG